MSAESCIFKKISADKTKITGAIWGPVNRTIICGHESGALTMLDASSGDCVKHINPHKGPVTDMQMHLTLPMLITGSKDHNAKVCYHFFEYFYYPAYKEFSFCFM
ncbi:unnamed protein product [Trichobilharzia regenti]|nr:unnamed protein product [Trichobilharzia regenti]